MPRRTPLHAARKKTLPPTARLTSERPMFSRWNSVKSGPSFSPAYIAMAKIMEFIAMATQTPILHTRSDDFRCSLLRAGPSR